MQQMTDDQYAQLVAVDKELAGDRSQEGLGLDDVMPKTDELLNTLYAATKSWVSNDYTWDGEPDEEALDKMVAERVVQALLLLNFGFDDLQARVMPRPSEPYDL
jgi:hypothetical protein